MQTITFTIRGITLATCNDINLTPIKTNYIFSSISSWKIQWYLIVSARNKSINEFDRIKISTFVLQSWGFTTDYFSKYFN